MTWAERSAGKECMRCGARRGLLVLIRYQPPMAYRQIDGAWRWVRVEGEWAESRYAHCIDAACCQARRDKQQDRSRERGRMLVLAEPKAPDAPRGTCRWCGEQLTGANAKARNYCYPDREGRDCTGEFGRSRVWTARSAVQLRGDRVCVDCGSDHWDWEADHEVPLADGGEHSMANLVRRCSECHREKTKRENSERAARRRMVRA